MEAHFTQREKNDMLSWLMDEAHNHGEEGDAVVLTQRILTLNFAAIHTTSMVRYLSSLEICMP